METRHDDWKKEVQRKFQERLRDYENTIEGHHSFASSETQAPLSDENIEQLKSKEMMESIGKVNNFFTNYKERNKQLNEQIQKLNAFNDKMREIELAMEHGWSEASKLNDLFYDALGGTVHYANVSTLNIQKAKEAIMPFMPFNDMSSTINRKLETLNAQLTEDTNKMREIRSILSNTFEDNVKNFSVKLDTCQICLEDKISTCCTPCGHCFCSTCISQINRCALCRTTITSKVKLYFNNSSDNPDASADPDSGAGVVSFDGFEETVASLAQTIDVDVAASTVRLQQPFRPISSLDIRDMRISTNF